MEKKIAKIIAAFKAGRRLTVLDALKEFGTTELRSIVCKIRKKGYAILSRQKPNETYNEYWLAND